MLMLIRDFVWEDTGDVVEFMFSSTVQPRVVGKEAQGSQLPLRVSPVQGLDSSDVNSGKS